jgi:hypothetical protein
MYTDRQMDKAAVVDILWMYAWPYVYKHTYLQHFGFVAEGPIRES